MNPWVGIIFRLAGIGVMPYIPIMTSELDKITAREKEIAQLITDLQKEAEELSVARRVLARFAPALPLPRAAVPSSSLRKLGPPRPVDAPTTFDMTDDVLADAERAGKDGLSGRELIDAIRDKYWPGLQSMQILPVIYGFVRNDRLRKTSGGKFKRLKKPENRSGGTEDAAAQN
jgi:hypothetical protein